MTRLRSTPRQLRLIAVPALALVNVALLAGCSGNTDVASAGNTAPEATVTESSTVATTSEATVGSTLDSESAGQTEQTEPIEQADLTSVDVDVDDLGAVGTLDSTTTHAISLEFDEADYEAMIATYTSTEEKQWIEATITIDGVAYEQAGIRLKGNSSLRGITGGGRGGAVGATDDTADAESPETLPWLIKLDKFVDGQNHEELTELVVRSNNSSTSLNEAVALELLGLAGLASQDAVAAGLSVNGSAQVLRLVIDNPEDEWMAEELDAGGALYKAEAGGDYSYRGDDPEAYVDVFDQEAGTDTTDLTPLIEFLDFINNSDDATFEAGLADHLDVDAFATYLAMQDLLGNFDDIDGPGNNSYLYYDGGSGQFTVVAWDYNLAFGQGPGGGGDTGGQIGGGIQPPAGDDRPTPPSGGGGMGGSNILVERFLAVDAWQQLYETRLSELRASLFDSGVARDILQAWAQIVSATGLVDDTAVTDEADRISQQLS